MKIEKSKFPIRIIVLPFVMIITFCYSMWQLIDFWFNFIVYGGEFIALTKTRTKATIAETYDKLQGMMKKHGESIRMVDESLMRKDESIRDFENRVMRDKLGVELKDFKPKFPIGIIAATKKRCFEMARDRGLKPIIEGVGDCVLITRIEDMKSYNFSEFITDEGVKFDSDWNQVMLHSLVVCND